MSTKTSGQHGAHGCQHTQQINTGDIIMAVNTRSRSTQETWLSPQTADHQGLFHDVINTDGVTFSHPRDVIDTGGLPFNVSRDVIDAEGILFHIPRNVIHTFSIPRDVIHTFSIPRDLINTEGIPEGS